MRPSCDSVETRFDKYMHTALYDSENGFYARSGRAGRRDGDFITSVEVGSTFGAVLAGALDSWWKQLGEPHPFVVAEAAAGTGALARSVLAAKPRCLGALRYVMVEVSRPQSQHHRDVLEAFVSAGAECTSMTDWPEHAHVGLANELLDNLAIRILDTSGFASDRVILELYVVADNGANEAVWRELPGGEHRDVPSVVIDAAGIVPWAHSATRWIRNATAVTDRLIVFDYGATTAELASRGLSGWLRAYRNHHRADPFADPGSADITADVAFDQLPAPHATTSQREWLRLHGIDEIVEAATARWQQRAHVGDLQALRDRSVIGEAAALTDPAGLGGFTVLTWLATSPDTP